mmetsp:Transcript_23124/g.48451  ORF Transcript_23124/g.48451 Transcript_23124/m.48451 type:complete len:216 (+) Transcript_23124:1047-1694(+)
MRWCLEASPISSLGRIMRSTSTRISRTLHVLYAACTCPGLSVLEDISLCVALTSPTRHDAPRFTSSPMSRIMSRSIFMSTRMVSTHRSTVLCRHHASCCPCRCARSCAGCRRHFTIARARSSSRQGFVRMIPGITLLQGANSESTSCPLLRPTSVARTYSKGTRLRPCRTAELTSASDAEKSAHRGAKGSFSCSSSTESGYTLLMLAARVWTSSM